MKNQKSKIYIAETDVGKGIFARKPIKKGEIILKYKGPIFNTKQIEKLEEKYRPGDSIQISGNKYMYVKKPGLFTNHSCNPNAGIKKDVILIAIKNIKENEEIRFDYSTTMDEDDWTMKCKCHQKNCRKIVKDFKYLPENTQKKYLRLCIVQNFIAKKYEPPKS